MLCFSSHLEIYLSIYLRLATRKRRRLILDLCASHKMFNMFLVIVMRVSKTYIVFVRLSNIFKTFVSLSSKIQ